MKNEGVVFCKKYFDYLGEERDAFQITVQGNAYDYLSTIQSLLYLLSGVSDEFDGQFERQNVCDLIKSMLPSLEQVKMIEDLQTKTIK